MLDTGRTYRRVDASRWTIDEHVIWRDKTGGLDAMLLEGGGMNAYEYRCPTHGIVKIADAGSDEDDRQQACEQCGAPLERWGVSTTERTTDVA
jgi:hypothetical protein